MKKASKGSRITLVELPPTQFGEYNGNPAYDVYSGLKLPSRALPALEAVLRNDNWLDVQSVNPIFHGANGRLTDYNERRIFSSDILGISSITRTSPQSMALGKKFKEKNASGIVIAGGPDPTFRAEEWLKQGAADIVAVGEAEQTLYELMNQLMQDPDSLSDIDGIAFKNKHEVIFTKPRKLMTREELSQLPQPFYDAKIRAGITTATIETSRGCPNDCDFCSVTKFYGREYRTKSNEYVLEGLRKLRDLRKTIFFTDDNFAGYPKRTMNLLHAIYENGLARNSCAQVTVKAAENKEIVNALKNAGIHLLCLGIESVNDETLRSLGKPYTAKQNRENVERLREEGFWVHGMMMIGGEGDTPQSVRQDFEWIKANLDTVQLFSATPVPGTEFAKRMKLEGRILTTHYHLYDGQHVVVRPKNFTPLELTQTINEMYEEFYSPKETLRRAWNLPLRDFRKKIRIAGLGGILASTQLIKKALYGPQEMEYLKFLKQVS